MLLASHPSRVRGLKRFYHGGAVDVSWVAPLTGAWIETPSLLYYNCCYIVAPLTGAWIETKSINAELVL